MLRVSGRARVVAVIFQTLGCVGVSQFFPKAQIPVAVVNTEDASSSKKNNNSSAKPLSEPTEAKRKWEFKARCPFDFTAPKSGQDEISGLKRVTRHPAFWTMSFLSLGVMFRTPYVTEVVAFAGPVLTTLLCGSHMDYRYRRGEGGTLTPEQEAKSSFFPFVALVEGRQSWSALWDEAKGLNAGIALFVSGVIAFRTRRLPPSVAVK